MIINSMTYGAREEVLRAEDVYDETETNNNLQEAENTKSEVTYGDAVVITLSNDAQKMISQPKTQAELSTGSTTQQNSEARNPIVVVTGHRNLDAMEGLDPYAEMSDLMRERTEQYEQEEANWAGMNDEIQYADNTQKPSRTSYVDSRGHVHIVSNKAQVLKEMRDYKSITGWITATALTGQAAISFISSSTSIALQGMLKSPYGLALSAAAVTLGQVVDDYINYVEAQPDNWVQDVDITGDRNGNDINPGDLSE